MHADFHFLTKSVELRDKLIAVIVGAHEALKIAAPDNFLAVPFLVAPRTHTHSAFHGIPILRLNLALACVLANIATIVCACDRFCLFYVFTAAPRTGDHRAGG